MNRVDRSPASGAAGPSPTRRSLLRHAAWPLLAWAGGCAAPPVAGPAASPAAPADPDAFGGRFERVDAFASRHAAPRRVVVWLPPGHDRREAPHRVLYMHDGQNLFHAADAYGGQTWGIVPALTRLRAAGRIPPTLVVGVWNTPLRSREYGPQPPVERLPAEWRDQVYGGAPLASGYLRFLAEELKPWVDARFHTRTGRADTVVMGSSMGGLASLHALLERPEVFGAAGCVSTHWPMSVNRSWITPPGDPRAAQAQQALRDWLAERLPAPGTHRLYFDHGDQELDALYPPLQAKVDAIVAARGWQRGRDWLSLPFPGTAHNEAAWRARVEQPLAFLLGSGA